MILIGHRTFFVKLNDRVKISSRSFSILLNYVGSRFIVWIIFYGSEGKYHYSYQKVLFDNTVPVTYSTYTQTQAIFK